MSSLLSSNSAAAAIGRVRCLADEEADHNMLQDLHLAAELGKTLLDRNKELETAIKGYLTTIEEQKLEIEYLKKSVAAMKEVNQQRIKVYESLENSVSELELKNQALTKEKAKDKVNIESLRKTLEEEQNKYHELEKTFEALEQERKEHLASPRNRSMLDCSIQNGAVSPTSPVTRNSELNRESSSANEEDIKRQLNESRQQRANVEKKLNTLIAQVETLSQEKLMMEDQINKKSEEVCSLKKDLQMFEELWKGKLCSSCEGNLNRETDVSLRMLEEDEELDTRSLAESMADSFQESGYQMQEFGDKIDSPEEDGCQDSYRLLVEKYEALVKVHQNAPRRKHLQATPIGPSSNGSGYLSLQEELQMSGEFNISIGGEPTRLPTSSHQFQQQQHSKPGGTKLLFSGTPTDFSEAETSSSGFAEAETSNKSTQTEGRPGSFLCSIASDADDCRFSIYDDTSTFESRFHQTPEYRKLFTEIFEVLKRAAEAKDLLAGEAAAAAVHEDEEEELVLTPMVEHWPGGPGFPEDGSVSETCTDDTNSVVSLAVSSVASEPVFRVHTPLFGRKEAPRQPTKQQPEQPEQPDKPKQQQQQQQQLRPLHNNTRRQPLEYLSVQVRKRPSGKGKRRSSSGQAQTPTDSSPAPEGHLLAPNPRVTQLRGSGRRKFRPLTASELSDGFVWNGSSAQFYPSKSARAARHRQPHHQQQQQQQQQQVSQSSEYKPGSALEEVAKLRRLEMSYAEVLRMPNSKSKAPGAGRQQHQQRRNNHHHH